MSANAGVMRVFVERNGWCKTSACIDSLFPKALLPLFSSLA